MENETKKNVSKPIIMSDNDFVLSDDNKALNRLIKQINRDKYNIVNLNSEFLHKNSNDTNIFFKVVDTDANNELCDYIMPGKYLGTFSIRENDEIYDILIKSRYTNLENENLINYILSNTLGFESQVFERTLNITSTQDEESIKINKIKTVNQTLNLLVFINALESAIRKGMFRKYSETECNDSKIKGRIDVSRHIVKNQSIQGKVAYTTREYTPINNVNRLILKTYIFYERTNRKLLKSIMTNYKEVEKHIVKLRGMFPNIEEFSLSTLIGKGNEKIVNLVYKEYEALRKICIGILKSKGESIFDLNDKRAKGIAIDIEEIWKKYVYKNILMKLDEELKNDEEKASNELKLLKNNSTIRDNFMVHIASKKIAFEAKYSEIWEESMTTNEFVEIKIDKLNEDFSKIVEFSINENCHICSILFPYGVSENLEENIEKFYGRESIFEKVEVPDVDVTFYKIPYLIPTNIESYDELVNAMNNINKNLIRKIIKTLK